MGQTADIKNRLILAALNLFAKQGIEGVSMRNINVMAGTKNSGAAHYHFGSKNGVIEALIEFLNAEILALREEHIQSLTADGIPDLTPKLIIHGFYTPYILLYKNREYGADAIRFFARMAIEADSDLQESLNKHFGQTFQMVDDMLASCMPDKDRLTLRRQLLFSWVSAIHGLADLDYMRNTFYGDISTPTQEELLDEFSDFIVAGMLGTIEQSNAN